MKAKHTILTSFIFAILLVVTAVTLSVWSFRQIEQAAEAQENSAKVLSKASELLSELKDAETGMRGFLLTGDEHFLEPYLKVQNSIPANINELQKLVFDPVSKKHLDSSVLLINAKLVNLANAVGLQRNNDLNGAIALVKAGEGKRLMDSIRIEINAFIKKELSKSKQREVDLKTKMRHLLNIIMGTAMLWMLLAIAFIYLNYQRAQQRIKNIVHLETQHLLGVQEQTSEKLQQANITLLLNEEKLRVTLSSIGDAVIATDAYGCITLLNPIAEQLTGWQLADAIGRPIANVFKIINKQTRLDSTIPVLETLAHGTVHGLANHTVLISRDGSECDIADSCAPICDRDGLVIGAVLVFRDVTEDYAIQQTLHDSSTLVQTVLNTVADGIVSLRANDSIIEKVNPAVAFMFGYTTNEILGQNLSLLIPELDQDQRNGSLDYYKASDENRASGLGREVQGRRKDGSVFPMEIAVSEMQMAGEYYFTGILRDVSIRKQAEDALFKAGALQRAIFNSANFSSIATDARGVIQIFNVGAERMLGYAAADVMNTLTPADISDPDEVIARAEALSHELGTHIQPGFEALVFKASRGIEDIYELTYIRKDGTRFPALVSVTALRDAHENIIGYLLIGTDNTARKQVEAEQKKLDQRLRDQQFYTRSLIEANIDALMTTDPFGIITDVNKQMERLTGCTRDELIGAPFKNYFTDPERAEAGIKMVLSKNKVTNYELTAFSRNGNETVVSYNATTFYDRDRNLQGVFAAARDISERILLDTALQENNIELKTARQAAEKANLAKSDFLSSMSHELRSPLNAILGFAQLMDTSTPAPSPAQKSSIKQILQAGWYLLELINEVLDLALIESGKLSISPEPISLNEVLGVCEDMIQPLADKNSIRIVFAQPDHNYFVCADRTRFKQVMINLLSNAIKYNRVGGSVEISTQAVSDSRLRISVQDTGEGLSADKLSQLFQPFNRLGQEAGLEEGTGIGLVVSKRLVELMDGEIGAQSTVGVGSVFWIELILTNEPEFEAHNTEHAFINRVILPNEGQSTLLYVEDNPANLLLVQKLLERRPDISLFSASNGTRVWKWRVCCYPK